METKSVFSALITAIENTSFSHTLIGVMVGGILSALTMYLCERLKFRHNSIEYRRRKQEEAFLIALRGYKSLLNEESNKEIYRKMEDCHAYCLLFFSEKLGILHNKLGDALDNRSPKDIIKKAFDDIVFQMREEIGTDKNKICRDIIKVRQKFFHFIKNIILSYWFPWACLIYVILLLIFDYNK